MTSAKKIYLARGGRTRCRGRRPRGHWLVASGFDPAVFTTQIDMRDDTVVLGGVEVGDPEGIPFIGPARRFGRGRHFRHHRVRVPCCPGGTHRSLGIARPDAPSVGLFKPVEPEPQPQPTGLKPASIRSPPYAGPVTHTQNPSEEKGTQ